MSGFFAALRELALLPDQAMAAGWEWRGSRGNGLQVRDALYKSLEEEQAALVAAPAPPTEAGRIVALGQRDYGRLRGLLAGLAEADLDRPPAAGEWTLRQVLAHVLLTERRYLYQVEYALRRGDREPVYVQPDIKLEPEETGGEVEAWAQRLAQARSDSASLAPTPDAALTRPTQWAGYDVDVRFRLHRFAAHFAEHSIQAEKTLAGLGRPPGEAHRIVMRISETRGGHELSTAASALSRLDQLHLERARDLAARA